MGGSRCGLEEEKEIWVERGEILLMVEQFVNTSAVRVWKFGAKPIPAPIKFGFFFILFFKIPNPIADLPYPSQ